jgi:hypothetical protein
MGVRGEQGREVCLGVCVVVVVVCVWGGGAGVRVQGM